MTPRIKTLLARTLLALVGNTVLVIAYIIRWALLGVLVFVVACLLLFGIWHGAGWLAEWSMLHAFRKNK